MEHYQLILAYDGTDYCGFQRQNRPNTIQSELESALRKIGWQGKAIQAAGRTDSGVHATGQVVAFYHEWQHSLKQMKAALNNFLPRSIAIQAVKIVTDDFHPRYDAVSREYKYAVTVAEDRQPEKERYMWRIYGQPDWKKTRETAALFLGKHDFSQFGRALKEDGSTEREVLVSEWVQVSPRDYEYTICANAFLYHMVRRIVFVLIKTGEGKIEQNVIGDALAGKKEKITAGIAPACGLTLTRVNYGETKDEREI